MNRFLPIILLIVFSSQAQQLKTPTKITYERLSNGKPSGQENVIVFADKSLNWITSEQILANKATLPFEQQRVEPNIGKYTQVATMANSKFAVTIDSTSIGKQQFELTDKTKKILGYNCKMAKTVINSNHIEVWYADAGLKAGPSVLGQQLGLVLEINRNGNYVTRATKIDKIRAIPSTLAIPKLPAVDMLSYRDLVWKSRFTNVKLFEKAQVNFNPGQASQSDELRLSDGMTLIRKVKVPMIDKNSQLFVDVTELSLGDVYDRTGLLFVIPTDDPDATLKALAAKSALPTSKNATISLPDANFPMLELLHYITPFGVGKYNTLEQKNRKWQDSVYYRSEITDLLPAINGKEILVGITIANYDKGGHQVNANLTIHNGEGIALPGNSVAVPVFNSVSVIENKRDFNAEFKSTDGAKATFTLSKPLKNARLRYLTTGHGGWENGDEFVPKINTILLDGKQVFSFVPWRVDCGSYRLSNPASGNFENGLSSSDYSRANWCPGTMTNPIWIDLGNLEAGEHTLSIKIPVGEPEGGSSSSWSVSGVLEGVD